MKNINAGEEITITYMEESELLYKKRQERQKFLLENFAFVCSCDFCQKDAEDETDLAFYESFDKMYQELKKLESFQRWRCVTNPEISGKCRREVNLYKQMYETGKEKT